MFIDTKCSFIAAILLFQNDSPYTLTIALLCNDSFSIVTEYPWKGETTLAKLLPRLCRHSAENRKTAQKQRIYGIFDGMELYQSRRGFVRCRTEIDTM